MTGNELLDHLPGAELQRLVSQSVQVHLHSGEQLAVQGQPALAVLLPMHGFVSLVTPLDAQPLLQVGMVGKEGVLGAELLLGAASSPVTMLVQESGGEWGLSGAAPVRLLPVYSTMRSLLLRYLCVQLRQAATAAACLHFHSLTPRLARWLLMSHDRAKGDCFAVIQESMAKLLGVRPVGVTVAAGGLQMAGLISNSRGRIIVNDRVGLQAAACGCYALDRASYRQEMRFKQV